MKILIDVGHPADFHLFRNFAAKMIEEGHDILFTCREKECLVQLLKHYKFNYVVFGQNYSSIVKKIYGLIKYDYLLLLASRKFRPDLFLSHGSIYSAHISFLLNRTNIAFEDTFNFEQIKMYKPFTKFILTSDYSHPLKSRKIIKYAGYHELAYLHPNNFLPDISIYNELGIDKNVKYVLIRFVSWNATHDIGHKGMSMENKLRMIKEFEKYCRVFISSEANLPSEFQNYKINIAPHRLHHAIAFANLVIGESFTMISEAAVLGVPAILIHNTKCYYISEQHDKYGLTFYYNQTENDQVQAIEKGIEILSSKNIKEEWQERRKNMLCDKIDVTAFMIWFINNYPKSVKIMNENTEYQQKFK